MNEQECQNCARSIATEVIQNDIQYIKESIGRMEDSLHTELDKKADKWVENAMKWVGTIIVGSVIVALLGLVLVPTVKAFMQ